MPKKSIYSFEVNDISALAKSLVKQISSSEAELNHSRMLNYLVKAAGYANWHQFIIVNEKSETNHDPKNAGSKGDNVASISEANSIAAIKQIASALSSVENNINLISNLVTNQQDDTSLEDKADQYSRGECYKELLHYKLLLLREAIGKTSYQIADEIGHVKFFAVSAIFKIGYIDPRKSEIVKRFISHYGVSDDWFYRHTGSEPKVLSEDALLSIENKIFELEKKRESLYVDYFNKHKAIKDIDITEHLSFD